MTQSREKKIKVLFLASWYPHDENPVEGIFIKRHAEAVSRLCDVGVLYIHPAAQRQETVVGYSVEDRITTIRVYPRLPRLNNKISRYLHQLLNMYRGMQGVRKAFGRPDIVHVNVTLPMGILAVFLEVMYKIPYIVTEHFTGFSGQTRIVFTAVQLKLILKRATAVCPVSTKLAQSMQLFYPADKYQVIPNVINTGIFFPKHGKKTQVKKHLLHVSVLKKERKNISGIIDALHDLLSVRNDFELHIIGEGIDRTYFEDLCTHLGMKDSVVFFHGFVSEETLAEYMRNADFFILNSTNENFAVVCAEALSSGIPVLSTICGGPEEFINEHVGILIPQGNKQELINGISYLIDNADTYDPCMLHNYIKNKFGYDTVGKQLFTLYSAIVNRQ
jgi:glycosyltransferase involved in cell wall biosynthesis